MSFYYSPTRLVGAEIPNLKLQEGIWIGKDADEGFFAFNTDTHYVITQNTLAYSLKVNGSICYPKIDTVIGGAVIWQGAKFIFKDRYSDIWYCGTSLTLSSKDGLFWQGTFPTLNSSSTFTPIYLALEEGKSNIEVEIHWSHWQSKTDSFLGEYTPKGNASGTKFIGTPQWQDDNGNLYTRSNQKVDNKYTYGAIKFIDDKWVIGNIGDSKGWHEGVEPNLNNSVIFHFKSLENSSATGKNKIISFHKYIMNSSKQTAYIGDAAIWR